MVSSALASGACSALHAATVAATTGPKPAAWPAPAMNSTSSRERRPAERRDQQRAAAERERPGRAEGGSRRQVRLIVANPAAYGANASPAASGV